MKRERERERERERPSNRIFEGLSLSLSRHQEGQLLASLPPQIPVTLYSLSGPNHFCFYFSAFCSSQTNARTISSNWIPQ